MKRARAGTTGDPKTNTYRDRRAPNERAHRLMPSSSERSAWATGPQCVSFHRLFEFKDAHHDDDDDTLVFIGTVLDLGLPVQQPLVGHRLAAQETHHVRKFT